MSLFRLIWSYSFDYIIFIMSHVACDLNSEMWPLYLEQFLLLSPVPSVLWHCSLGGRKGIWPVKNWAVGCWHGSVWSEVQTCIWPSWYHCHSVTVSCFSKIQIGFTFLVLAHPRSPGQSAVKRVCVFFYYHHWYKICEWLNATIDCWTCFILTPLKISIACTFLQISSIVGLTAIFHLHTLHGS